MPNFTDNNSDALCNRVLQIHAAPGPSPQELHELETFDVLPLSPSAIIKKIEFYNSSQLPDKKKQENLNFYLEYNMQPSKLGHNHIELNYYCILLKLLQMYIHLQ